MDKIGDKFEFKLENGQTDGGLILKEGELTLKRRCRRVKGKRKEPGNATGAEVDSNAVAAATFFGKNKIKKQRAG